jgi:CRISPR-associated endonuclease Csy4
MKFYLDIQVQPDAEMAENILMNKVYSKLHKALYDLNSTAIGISFPSYKVMLGNVIRVHGAEDKVIALQATQWLGGLSGYCQVSAIQEIPNQVTYRTIARKQANMTNAKLKRLLKRGSISKEDAKQYTAKMFTQGFDNAYFELESTSNNQLYRRYIEFGNLQEQKTSGNFDSFGLSKVATIPWF